MSEHNEAVDADAEFMQAFMRPGEVFSRPDQIQHVIAPRDGARSKYHREIKPGVFVDVYDVLHAWRVTNPALQHLVKKALQPGERGHKTLAEDLNDIIVSAKRAAELEQAE